MRTVSALMKNKGYTKKGNSHYLLARNIVFAVKFSKMEFNPDSKIDVGIFDKKSSFTIDMEVLYPVGNGAWMNIQPFAFQHLRRDGSARLVEFNFEIDGIFFKEEEQLVCQLLASHLDRWRDVLTDAGTCSQLLLWLRGLGDLPAEFSYFNRYTQSSRSDFRKFHLSGESSVFRQDDYHRQLCSAAYFNVAGEFENTLKTLPLSGPEPGQKIINDAFNRHIALDLADLKQFGLA